MGLFVLKKNDSGFTLVEVMIALSVLLIGLLGIAGMLVVAIDSNGSTKRTTEATYLAEQTLEQFRGMPYQSIQMMTATDTANNTKINARGDQATDLPCIYTRSWSVYQNTTSNFKKIDVTVNWNYKNQPHGVTLATERSE